MSGQLTTAADLDIGVEHAEDAFLYIPRRLVVFKKLQRKRKTEREFKREPCNLATLILQTAQSTDQGCESSFKDFVRHRYWRPFDHSVRSSFFFAFAFTSLTVTAIAAGLASSVLATTSWDGKDVVIAILGLLAAISTAINRLWRPGLRSAMRHRAANELRREGWAFVRGQGRYADIRAKNRVDAFFVAIESINRVVEELDETPVEVETQG
jgi:hypothetical protein